MSGRNYSGNEYYEPIFKNALKYAAAIKKRYNENTVEKRKDKFLNSILDWHEWRTKNPSSKPNSKEYLSFGDHLLSYAWRYADYISKGNYAAADMAIPVITTYALEMLENKYINKALRHESMEIQLNNKINKRLKRQFEGTRKSSKKRVEELFHVDFKYEKRERRRNNYALTKLGAIVGIGEGSYGGVFGNNISEGINTSLGCGSGSIISGCSRGEAGGGKIKGYGDVDYGVFLNENGTGKGDGCKRGAGIQEGWGEG